MTGLLLKREVFVQHAEPGRASREFDTWMGIYPAATGDNRIGFVHSVSTPTTRGGIGGAQLELTVKLATTMLNAPTEIAITGTAWIPDDTGLADFSLKIRSFGHVMRVSGHVGDEALKLEIETAGERFPIEFPVGRDLLLSGGMGTTTMNLPVLEVGEKVLIDAFDPLTLSTGKAHIECVGLATVQAAGRPVDTKIMTATLSGITSKFWVTPEEEIVRIETPYGFTLRKITREEALGALGPGGAEELINMMAVKPRGLKPFRGAARMKIRLTGIASDIAPPSDDLQQRLEDGIYLIQSPEAPWAEESGGEDLNEYLKGDPFVQVGHPRIAEQALDILGTLDDPWERALALYQWVYDSIEKTIVLSFPSALEVLDVRQGDCNEHTVLYAALSRTAGIPTRIAIGVVWSDTLQGFYYHAWPEVHVGRWIPVDPTLGQPIADATHIKLLTGNIEAWPQLVPYLGRLNVEVLEVE